MTPLAGAEAVLRTMRAIAAAPTAPYHEDRALAAIRSELGCDGIEVREDAYGQVFARLRRGPAGQPIVFVAHADHPAFEVIHADGNEGTARILGGFRGPVDTPTRVRVYSDRWADASTGATVDRFVPDTDPIHHSPGRVRIRAEGALAPGDWAVLDLPAFAVRGDELYMAAADDLAGCAMAVRALREIARMDGPVDVMAVFTRAEETGLFGARIVAHDEAIPRDAIVVSIEASRALPHVPPAEGIVVRVGDRDSTFDNAAEARLRAAAERLAASGIRTQRALLDGGTCEASAFVRNGWSATAIALPNVNYHNRGANGHLVCEIVRLSDVRSGIALLVETARSVASGERETTMTDVGPVPEEIRALLRQTRS